MIILITGGLGFLGSNLSKKILDNTNYELLILDNCSRIGSRENLKWLKTSRKFKFINDDVRNYNLIKRKIKLFKPDFIFHFAGQVTMTRSLLDPLSDFEINVIGTINLLESIRLYSPKSKIIFSSTNKVYGDLEQFKFIEKKYRYECKNFKKGFDEKINLSFHSPYGCSKGSAEQYILDYHRVYGLKVCVYRHSSMYGQRQFPTHDQGWIGWFCLEALKIKLKKKSFIEIMGSGKQVRDLLFIDDMIDLYLKSIKNFNKINGTVYNIGGGYKNSLSILELVKKLESIMKISISYKLKKGRISDQKIFIAEISKIKRDLNWYPKISAKKGIIKYLKWIDTIK